MAHRNRWFTWVYLLKMVDLSMAMLVITRWYVYISDASEICEVIWMLRNPSAALWRVRLTSSVFRMEELG